MYILLSQHVLGCIESGCQVSLKGFPNLHKLAAFKNHLNAMASQNRFRWSHLVQIGTWSAVTKSKFTHKKESRAAFETVLQQAN